MAPIPTAPGMSADNRLSAPTAVIVTVPLVELAQARRNVDTSAQNVNAPGAGALPWLAAAGRLEVMYSCPYGLMPGRPGG
jgi:hypothetical protein